MEYTKSLKLDMNPSSVPPVIRVKQGDGFARFVRITLTRDGVTYIPEEGVYFVFRCEKPDGRAVVTDSRTTDPELERKLINVDTSTGVVTVELIDQVDAVVGLCKCDLCLIKAEKVLSTVPFMIEIIASPDVADRSISSDAFRVFENALAEFDEKIDEVDEVVEWAHGEVDDTVDWAHDEIDAAVDRADTATANTNAAIANAETATTNANTATTNANTARDNANAAATNANKKADLANTAASTANTAASTADTATANANTARDRANAAAASLENMTASGKRLDSGSNPTAEVTTVPDASGTGTHYNVEIGVPSMPGVTASGTRLDPGATPTATVTGGMGGAAYNINLGIPSMPNMTASAEKLAPDATPTAVVQGGTGGAAYNIKLGIPSMPSITASAQSVLPVNPAAVVVTGGQTAGQAYNLAFDIPSAAAMSSAVAAYGFSYSEDTLPSSWESSIEDVVIHNDSIIWTRLTINYDDARTPTVIYMKAAQGHTGPAGVVVQTTTPETDTLLWVNPDADAKVIIPDIKDDTVAPDSTYSSRKIEALIANFLSFGVQQTLTETQQHQAYNNLGFPNDTAGKLGYTVVT